MSVREIGSRIGAILGSNPDGTVSFLDYGVYAGDHMPPVDAGGFAGFAHLAGRTNPRLDLDNGQTVWGGECWWGPEDKIRAMLAQYAPEQIIATDIAEARERERAVIAAIPQEAPDV